MAWFTTDDGRHVNTDWLDPEDQLKYKQIQANKMVAQQLSGITHPMISKSEGSGKVFTSYNNNAPIKGNKNVNSAPEQEYERTSKMDWIDKRIEGKKKELEKAEKKLERIKAAQASNWTKNPYWYNERDLVSTQKDIDRIKADMDKYAADMQTEIDKAKSRNVPAITNFLNDWKEKSINFYLKEKTKYNEAYKEYQDQYEEYRKWKYSDAGYNASREEHEERYKESERRRKQFKNDWTHVTQFQAGSGTWEENMRKAVEDERVRKYDDIIERTTAVTGRITNANHLRVGGKGDLNGVILGEKGAVRLETIGAGGYNIQRFHFRTLIHGVDKESYEKYLAEQDKKAAPKPEPKKDERIPFDKWENKPEHREDHYEADPPYSIHEYDETRYDYEKDIRKTNKKSMLEEVENWKMDDGSYGDGSGDQSIHVIYDDGSSITLTDMDAPVRWSKQNIRGISVSTGDYEMVWGEEYYPKSKEWLPLETHEFDDDANEIAGYTNSYSGRKAVARYKVRMRETVTLDKEHNRWVKKFEKLAVSTPQRLGGDNLAAPKVQNVFSRYADTLSKKGISTQWEIENYIRSLSPTRRNRLAKEMGIVDVRGDQKLRIMVNRIFSAGKDQ